MVENKKTGIGCLTSVIKDGTLVLAGAGVASVGELAVQSAIPSSNLAEIVADKGDAAAVAVAASLAAVATGRKYFQIPGQKQLEQARTGWNALRVGALTLLAYEPIQTVTEYLANRLDLFQ